MSNTASMGYDGYGGGFSLDSAIVNLDGATGVLGNIASTEGYGYGGGLYLSSSTASLSSATVVGGTQPAQRTTATVVASDEWAGYRASG